MSESIENYLATIYETQLETGFTRVKEIAQALSKKHSTVIETLKKLKKSGLLEYEKHGYVSLTSQGKKTAQRFFQARRLLVLFFRDTMQLEQEQAQEIACKVEHLQDTELLDRLLALGSFFSSHPQTYSQWKEFVSQYTPEDRFEAMSTLDQANSNQALEAGEVPGDPFPKKRP